MWENELKKLRFDSSTRTCLETRREVFDILQDVGILRETRNVRLTPVNSSTFRDGDATFRSGLLRASRIELAESARLDRFRVTSKRSGSCRRVGQPRFQRQGQDRGGRYEMDRNSRNNRDLKVPSKRPNIAQVNNIGKLLRSETTSRATRRGVKKNSPKLPYQVYRRLKQKPGRDRACCYCYGSTNRFLQR